MVGVAFICCTFVAKIKCHKCYNTVANIGVLANRKIKVKPTDENILHVLSLRSTVILKDNIIQVF